jgi:hypothetical protein
MYEDTKYALEVLSETMEVFPGLRICQLIVNALNNANTLRGNDPYYVNDRVLLSALLLYRDEHHVR